MQSCAQTQFILTDGDTILMLADDPIQIIEKAVGELYRGYYLLRKAERYQEEYDSMGALINMLGVVSKRETCL